MSSAPVSMVQLMRNGPKSMSEVVREGFKSDVKEAAMLKYIPARAAAVTCTGSVPVVGTFGTWYISKPADFITEESKPKMDSFMSSVI
mmetsp:Transcript_5427/g.16129  ORF Transcript_5427/g.16129 Transcript_5427/m.16129 type:complete len:88 (+) Transcript_5427:64-327(+)